MCLAARHLARIRNINICLWKEHHISSEKWSRIEAISQPMCFTVTFWKSLSHVTKRSWTPLDRLQLTAVNSFQLHLLSPLMTPRRSSLEKWKTKLSNSTTMSVSILLVTWNIRYPQINLNTASAYCEELSRVNFFKSSSFNAFFVYFLTKNKLDTSIQALIPGLIKTSMTMASNS